MRRRSPLLATMLAASCVLAWSGTAFADSLQEEIEPVGLCLGTQAFLQRNLPVVRTPLIPQWPDDGIVALVATVIDQPDNATIVVTVTDSTIVLPSDWTSQPPDTLSSDRFVYLMTITATGVGSDTGGVQLQASSGGAASIQTVPVVVESVDCTPPTPTPTPTPTATPTPTSSPTPTPTPLPTATAVPTATAAPTSSVAPTSTTRPSMPDTAVAVEPRTESPGGGSMLAVLAVLVGIAGGTAALTVRRVRRR